MQLLERCAIIFIAILFKFDKWKKLKFLKTYIGAEYHREFKVGSFDMI